MQITIAMMVLGAVFVFLSYNFSKRTFSWPVMILGLAFILLSRTTESLLGGMQLIHAGPTVALCIGGLLIGALVVYAMIELLNNTSPHSTSFGQYMFFGCCKWDDFGEFLLIGIVIVGISAYTLWEQMSRSWAYARASESVQSLAHEPTGKRQDKSNSSTNSKNSDSHKDYAIKPKHATAQHGSTKHAAKHSTKNAASHNN